jgi:hypothetical protein
MASLKRLKITRCVVCGEATEEACSDCYQALHMSVYVCTKERCRNEHEVIYHGKIGFAAPLLPRR